MGAINQNNAPKDYGKIRVKKLSTRVDMTPMVDLAFLLLTFFILTATFGKFNMMQVDVPEPVPEPRQQPVNVKDVLNVVLAEDDRIFWWVGLDPPVVETNYSKDGIRKLLIEKGKANRRLVVLIKPRDESKYSNMVDILDELSITNTPRFTIMDFTEDDQRVLSGELP